MCVVWQRLKQIMGRWMCGVSLKDRKRSVDFNSFLGVHAECGRCGEAKQNMIISIWFDRLNIWRRGDWRMIGGWTAEMGR